MKNTIELGHSCRDSKFQNIDTTKVFNESKCVLHLIDLNVILENPSTETDYSEIISRFISDQHAELWRMMKRGDFLQNIDIISENEFTKKSCLKKKKNKTKHIHELNKRFIIEKNTNELDLDIIRNGLMLKECYTWYNNQATIYPNVYTITQFPVGYFDDIVVNNYLCPSININTEFFWKPSEKSPIVFNVKKLRLNTLNKDNIFTYNTNFEYVIYCLYIIINYRKTDYMIIREYSHKYFDYDMKEEVDKFIKLFDKSRMLECYELTDAIKNVAKKENINIKNVCHI
jgi:hypothetical protein